MSLIVNLTIKVIDYKGLEPFHKAPDKSPLAYHSLKTHNGTLNFDDFTFYILHQSKGNQFE